MSIHQNEITPLHAKQTLLHWTNLSVSTKTTTILASNSGCCKPGQMLAIMGGSGAGKSTLVGLLAGKKASGLKAQGKVYANNGTFSAQQFYNFGSYVFQNDVLNESLTVRQTLQFGAKLSYKDSAVALAKSQKIHQQFGLTKCLDTQVGGKFIKGISGGQKKRLCIAIEMISEPSLLILDEPTSGLDSYMANAVIKKLKAVAQRGCTIIMTLHQPSFNIYQQIDRLMLLHKGQIVYQGPAATISDYIQSVGITVRVRSSISDFFMAEVSQFRTLKDPNYVTPINAANYAIHLAPQIENETKLAIEASDQEQHQPKVPLHSFFVVLGLLLRRQSSLFFGNKMKIGRNVGSSVMTGLIVGLIYINQLSNGRPEGVSTFEKVIGFVLDAQSASFLVVTSAIMNSLFGVLLLFPAQREVFCKETSSKKYTPLAYFLSKVMIEVAGCSVSTFSGTFIAFWLFGFTRTFQNCLFYSITILFVSLVGNSIGILAGSLFKTIERASALVPLFILPFMLFGGLYNKSKNIPEWIGWVQYLSPFRYGMHALMVNELGDTIFICSDLPTPYNYRTDLQMTESYGFNLLIIAALSLLYYVLSFICLKKLVKGQLAV